MRCRLEPDFSPLLHLLTQRQREDFQSMRQEVEDQFLRQLFSPTVDILEESGHYTLLFDLPGVKQEDLEIDVTDGNYLTLSGKRTTPEGKYAMHERGAGKFSRKFTLPDAIDISQISAELKDGVLSIVIPRTKTDKTRKIPVL